MTWMTEGLHRHLTHVISNMYKVVTCCLQLYLFLFILDVNQEWIRLEPEPQMWSVMIWVTVISLKRSTQDQQLSVHVRSLKLRLQVLRPPSPQLLHNTKAIQRKKWIPLPIQTQATTLVTHLLILFRRNLILKKYEVTCSLLVLFRYGPPHIWDRWTADTDRCDLQAAHLSLHAEKNAGTKYVAGLKMDCFCT